MCQLHGAGSLGLMLLVLLMLVLAQEHQCWCRGASWCPWDGTSALGPTQARCVSPGRNLGLCPECVQMSSNPPQFTAPPISLPLQNGLQIAHFTSLVESGLQIVESGLKHSSVVSSQGLIQSYFLYQWSTRWLRDHLRNMILYFVATPFAFCVQW